MEQEKKLNPSSYFLPRRRAFERTLIIPWLQSIRVVTTSSWLNYPSLLLAGGLPWKRPKCCYSTVANYGSFLGTDQLGTLISSGHRGGRRAIIDFSLPTSSTFLEFLLCPIRKRPWNNTALFCFLLYDSFKMTIHSWRRAGGGERNISNHVETSRHIGLLI